MKSSQLVTAGNAYLADRARKAGAVHVEVVPTVVDLSAYSVRFRSFSNTAVRVGWIGTPNTWNAFGKTLHTQINDTLAAHGARSAQLVPSLRRGVLETWRSLRGARIRKWTQSRVWTSVSCPCLTPLGAWQVRLQADTVYGLWLASCGLTSRRE